MSVNRGGAEERLLTELKQVVAEQPAVGAAAAEPRVARASRWRPRLALAAAGAAAGIAIAAAVPFVFQSDGDPAYAVEVQKDGTVQVTIEDARDPEGLERELEDAGVPAEVVYLEPGQTCKRPWYEGAPQVDGPKQVIEVTRRSRDGLVFLIDPDLLRDGETVVITGSYDSEVAEGMTSAFMGIGVATGEVPPCKVADAGTKPGSGK